MSDQNSPNTDTQKRLAEVLLAIDQVLLDMQKYYMWKFESPDPVQLLQDLETS